MLLDIKAPILGGDIKATVKRVKAMERDIDKPVEGPTAAPYRTGSFEEFKAYTLAVVRGERTVDPNTPKIWIERAEQDGAFPFLK
jgi:hypothetical protein